MKNCFPSPGEIKHAFDNLIKTSGYARSGFTIQPKLYSGVSHISARYIFRSITIQCWAKCYLYSFCSMKLMTSYQFQLHGYYRFYRISSQHIVIYIKPFIILSIRNTNPHQPRISPRVLDFMQYPWLITTQHFTSDDYMRANNCTCISSKSTPISTNSMTNPHEPFQANQKNHEIYTSDNACAHHCHHPGSFASNPRAGQCPNPGGPCAAGVLPKSGTLRTRQSPSDDDEHADRVDPEGGRFPRIQPGHAPVVHRTVAPVPSGRYCKGFRSSEHSRGATVQSRWLPLYQA